MTDITILDLILTFAVGCAIGHAVTKWIMSWTTAELLRDLGVTPDRLTDLLAQLEQDGTDQQDIVIDMRVEKHEEILYAYNKDTGKFIGQAADRITMIERLTEECRTVRNDVRYRIAEEDGAEYLKE